MRDPDFRRLSAATALGQLGDRIIFLALPLVGIVALNADEFQVGMLTAMTTAGSLLVGLPAGAWVDHMRKRSVMISTDLVRALLLLSVPLAWWAHLLTIRWLYALALAHGLLTVFFDVAYVSCLPHLVGRDHLVEGNAKLSAIRSVTSIGGPAVAGPLVGWFGAPWRWWRVRSEWPHRGSSPSASARGRSGPSRASTAHGRETSQKG
ncbi:MFS transporter [Streptomyces sp. MMG1121]|uniref:MFS transporter n=1 Tax=Streptomyces sp. MMG1121 TaxID=1415544 RepID=UPI0022771485|nr:MFS transporter [Streptomyces sp. MMG1121]